MKIDIILDEKYKETEVKIYTSKRDDAIVKKIEQIDKHNIGEDTVNGYKDKELYKIKLSDINRFYTELGYVYAIANSTKYKIKQKLYEIEERMENTSFIRISKSEIVNIDKILKFDMSFVGTIQVYFIDGSTTYVSRRFVKKVKEFLRKEKGCGKNEKSND